MDMNKKITSLEELDEWIRENSEYLYTLETPPKEELPIVLEWLLPYLFDEVLRKINGFSLFKGGKRRSQRNRFFDVVNTYIKFDRVCSTRNPSEAREFCFEQLDFYYYRFTNWDNNYRSCRPIFFTENKKS